MADHDHEDGEAGHGHDHSPDLALSVLTVLGLAVALVDRFWLPLPNHPPALPPLAAFLAGADAFLVAGLAAALLPLNRLCTFMTAASTDGGNLELDQCRVPLTGKVQAHNSDAEC